MNTKNSKRLIRLEGKQKKGQLKKMGWLTGIEPATTGITIRGSTN